jgi:hypothetical protein
MTFELRTLVSFPPTMRSVGARTWGSADPARSGRPPRETMAPTPSGRAAAATSAAAAPVLAPCRPLSPRLRHRSSSDRAKWQRFSCARGAISHAPCAGLRWLDQLLGP